MTQQPNSPTPSAGAEAAAISAWPGGWYVYENGKVEGPMSAEAAFSLASETMDGKPRLVSRKGFSQWYALKDLSEIFRMTDQLGRKVDQARVESFSQVADTKASPAKSEKPTLLKSKKPKSIVTPVSEPEPKPLHYVKAKEAVAEAKTPGPFSATEKKPLPSPESQVASPAKAPAKLTPKALVMQEYFLQRGRLRLGKIRNPWSTAFLGLPFSLGAYWAIWFGDLTREINWHVNGKEEKHSSWPAIIPIVHIFMIHKLAKRIVELEAQNKYRSVSPLVAALFAIVPPFALAYLQDAANRHWILHARHATQRKPEVSSPS